MGDRKITEGLVVTCTASALFDDVSGWPSLRLARQEAQKGDGITFAHPADFYNSRNQDGIYKNKENNGNMNVN